MPDEPLPSSRCPPPEALDAFAASGAGTPELRAHVEGCASCRDYVQALQRAADAHLRADARAGQGRPSALGGRSMWLRLMLVGAAVALAVVVVKGMPKLAKQEGLTVYVGRGTGPQRKAVSGSPVATGDLLRFQYAAPAEGFLMILGGSEGQPLNLFHPHGVTEAAKVAAGPGPAPVPETVLLDAAPGAKRIASIFRREPFTLEQAQGWLGTGPGTGARCEDCRIQWVILQRP